MGSGPRGDAQGYIKNQSDTINQQRDNLSQGLQNNVKDTQATYNGQMDQANKAYQNLTPDHINAMWSGSAPTFSDMATKGVNSLNPDAMSAFNAQGKNVNTAESDFQSIFDKPISDEDKNTMLANGTFQKFIDTGGFSQDDIQNLRARSISPLLSTFSNANNEIARTRSLQGGYSPNTTAALAANARNLGYGAADASTNVEAGLADSIRSGKEWGAQGMSAAGTNIADLTQRGKVSGATGLAQTALAEQSAQKSIMDLDAEMKKSGAAGLSDQEKASLAAELTAAGGKGNLASLAAGQANQATGSMLHNADEQQSANLGLTQDQMNSFNIPNGFQNAMGNVNSVLGTAGNIAGAASGGFGGFGGFLKNDQYNPLNPTGATP